MTSASRVHQWDAPHTPQHQSTHAAFAAQTSAARAPVSDSTLADSTQQRWNALTQLFCAQSASFPCHCGARQLPSQLHELSHGMSHAMSHEIGLEPGTGALKHEAGKDPGLLEPRSCIHAAFAIEQYCLHSSGHGNLAVHESPCWPSWHYRAGRSWCRIPRCVLEPASQWTAASVISPQVSNPRMCSGTCRKKKRKVYAFQRS